MMTRTPFGYVVSIDGGEITLNLSDAHKGQVAAHPEGVIKLTSIGSFFGVDSGSDLLILRVRSLRFAEPKEAHNFLSESKKSQSEPLRHLVASVVGVLRRKKGKLDFTPDSLISPPLGAEAFPLSPEELNVILNLKYIDGETITLGESVRNGGNQWVNVNDLLSRHVAVLGSTGQGKSCFTASILQQLVKFPKSRIIVFDINGEYSDSLVGHLDQEKVKTTTLGGEQGNYKIPYYALGRHGLGRLLLPSEKTQRPALNFALEHLHCLEYSDNQKGAKLAGTQGNATLFDDCRPGEAIQALNTIESLRNNQITTTASMWPHMDALSCLVAESYCVKRTNRNNAPQAERNAFEYGNIAPLLNRIKRLIDDPMFTSVVNVTGGHSTLQGNLNWHQEAKSLVSFFFGDENETTWNVHIVDLRSVAHDLLPFILGSLLESFSYELFKRGAGVTHPTLLILEEAHHYLRQLANNDDTGKHSLAYERLAKEGRKFGISLWLSTQRPSELSSTVLSQCGTWIVFRLASENDLKAVASATEWLDRNEVRSISGLPRRNAILFGASVALPSRIVSHVADPLPRSHDPDFAKWN